MLTLNDISCSRNQTTLFSQLNLTIPPASLVAIHGHNGSGKTSLLQIIAGLLPPCNGKVTFQQPTQITYIETKPAMKSSLTVKENLTFWANYYGQPQQYAHAMNHFGMTPIQDLPFYKCSSGWKQRISLSRLLLSNTPIWLMDEPLNFLDSQAKKQLYSAIEQKLAQQGIVIIATHETCALTPTITLSIEDWQ